MVLSKKKTVRNNGQTRSNAFLRAPCPPVDDIVKCAGFKGKSCSKKGKKICTRCGKKCLPGTAKNICKLKKQSTKYYAHCPSMRIHVVDLDGNRRTYNVIGSDLLSSIENKTSIDTGLDVLDINIKNAKDLALGNMEKNLKQKIKHDDTLFLYYHIHVVDLEGDRLTHCGKA